MSDDVFASWQKEFTRDRVEARVCFNRALLAELDQAEKALAAIPDSDSKMLEGNPDRAKAEKRVQTLRQQIGKSRKTLWFESIGTREWRKLLGEHPPTDEQKEATPTLDHNPETFPVAALVRSCVDPGLSLEQAKWLMEELSVAETDKVWTACLAANITGARDPFDDAIASLRRGGRRSTPQ